MTPRDSRRTPRGLTHPEDLQAWQAWQARRNLPRTLKDRTLRKLGRGPAPEPAFVLHRRGPAPRILVAVESDSPTQRAALLRPLEHLAGTDLAVLAPQDLTARLPGEGWSTEAVPAGQDALDQALSAAPEPTEVLTVGHYLPVGQAVDQWRTRRGLRSWVVQHGLLAPMAPPLPQGVRLLAFSRADAAFWTAGRRDVESLAIGSQLLWEAAGQPAARTDPALAPVYLGQLHGAELSRLGLARSSYAFCREHGAQYRPHPGERDLLSRAVHALWARRGLTVQQDPPPLGAVRAPVVSAFSTGILEAAARGLDAWAYHRRPPAWLEEFWDRYGMSTWGQPPTSPPAQPEREPARAVAELLRARIADPPGSAPPASLPPTATPGGSD